MTGMTKDEARRLLRARGLRFTAPRVAVLQVLAASARPLSYREVHERLGDALWDPTTTYRNLVKLRDAGVAPVVSRADGIDRYALLDPDEGHRHPHFLCDDCGQLTCLPPNVIASTSLGGGWSASVAAAAVQLHGTCPDCG